MLKIVVNLVCALILWTPNDVVSGQWLGPSYYPFHHNSANYLEQSSKPFGLPNRRNLAHGYLDDGSGLNEYKRWHGETSILGIPGTNAMIGNSIRRNWPFNDFVSFVKTLRLQHQARYGENTQVEAVTPHSIKGSPDYMPKSLMQAVYG